MKDKKKIAICGIVGESTKKERHNFIKMMNSNKSDYEYVYGTDVDKMFIKASLAPNIIDI